MDECSTAIARMDPYCYGPPWGLSLGCRPPVVLVDPGQQVDQMASFTSYWGGFGSRSQRLPPAAAVSLLPAHENISPSHSHVPLVASLALSLSCFPRRRTLIGDTMATKHEGDCIIIDNKAITGTIRRIDLQTERRVHIKILTWYQSQVPSSSGECSQSHRLYGHVDGTTPAPPKFVNREIKRTVVGNEAVGSTAGNEIRIEYETVDNPEHELWMAHDQSLVAYITSTLSEEVLGSIDDDLTAMELGTTLPTTYSQVSEARFLQLRKQFQDIKRGTCSVLEYLNEIKNVSDQLAAIGHPVSDKDKVQQALSGLGAKFDIFCTALEVLPIVPSFEDLKAKLFQHEASRVQRQNPITSNSHNVLITGTHPLQGNRTRPWTPQTGMGRGILSTPPDMNATSRRVPTCFYCNKKGHVKLECWHNPQNKGNQVRRENRAAAGSTSSSSNPTSNVPADVQKLLMTTLSKLNLKQNEQGEWYVDSGAATHVTSETGCSNQEDIR
ncbi:Retrovirus-related Pol polyprotein from transposon TNT 1-94 [Nymphaea thermarum]|nr:Retrovirus-related Pol polyprotein from transposon TNT 1-94 [Nymphaea thermarum]